MLQTSIISVRCTCDDSNLLFCKSEISCNFFCVANFFYGIKACNDFAMYFGGDMITMRAAEHSTKLMKSKIMLTRITLCQCASNSTSKSGYFDTFDKRHDVAKDCQK